MDDTIKENRRDALHLPPYNPNLKPIKLVWGRHKKYSTRMHVYEFEGNADILQKIIS
jgi:transposase